jgi:hypothetical protein
LKSRARAAAFAGLALLAAALAAAITSGYGSSVAGSYGRLLPVVVTSGPLTQGRVLGPARLASLAVHRVPERFVPAGALARPADALGLAPRVDLPAGSYLLTALLRSPRPQRSGAVPGLAPGLRPVEITVTGAGALEAMGPIPRRAAVDVIVTSEPRGAGPGRTYIAAAAVPLIALGPGPEGPGAPSSASAILGLSRPQALRLIAAENFARQVRLLPAVSP